MMAWNWSTSMSQHLLNSYNLIATKLKKKRILSSVRKPNLSATVDQFHAIIASFKREGSHRYAAFCCLAVARCEQAMKTDSSMEASEYLDAGYLLAQDELDSSVAMRCKGFEEDISEAVNCYLLAIKIYIKHQRMALVASLYYEMGSILKDMHKLEQASMFLIQAASIQQQGNPLGATHSLLLASRCKFALRDYKGASECLIQLIKIVSETEGMGGSGSGGVEGWSGDFVSSTGGPALTLYTVNFPLKLDQLIEARITLILLLTLQDGFLQAKDHIGKLVEDVGQAGVGIGGEISDELITLLQNLVMACERREVSGLRALQRELWSSLTDSQNEILQLIAAANKMLF
eukprot:TRINITY_DN4494_c0_g1_i2.p1 TRINITY_DN4494_c0_g1~~TRINITY_DN4494_c0_g1_i2.p1  ORF type:complete len:347 (-),score=62.37 TRINITY_DN4494_c0_g1_i2:44-1084(-)